MDFWCGDPILRQRGYDAHTAYSAERALEWCRDQQPDAVITDVIMGPMNGVQLAIPRHPPREHPTRLQGAHPLRPRPGGILNCGINSERLRISHPPQARPPARDSRLPRKRPPAQPTVVPLVHRVTVVLTVTDLRSISPHCRTRPDRNADAR